MADGTDSNPLTRRAKYTVQGAKLALDRMISKTGYRVVRTAHLDVMKLDAALKRVFARPQTIKTVIDIGASNGSWSKLVQEFLPSASFMLVEANDYHEANLRAYKASDARVDYVIAAAADEVGEINFDAEDPFGGLASHRDIDEYRATNVQSPHPVPEQHFRTVPAVTVDSLVRERNLQPPYFIKLDTHGFEIPILEGAAQSLGATELLQIEAYNFPITTDSLKFHELVDYMESKGFGVIDMCDPIHRPLDDTFWQIDIFFAPLGRPEFATSAYE